MLWLVVWDKLYTESFYLGNIFRVPTLTELPPNILLGKNFKNTEKLKELYSEHP